MNPRNSNSNNGINTNQMPSHNDRATLSSSLPSTYVSDLSALRSPTAGNPFRHNLPSTPPSSLIYGPSIPKHLSNMQPLSLNNNRGRGSGGNGQSNRSDPKYQGININYLLKAAPHLLQSKDIVKKTDDLVLPKSTTDKQISDRESRNLSNSNGSGSSSSKFKHLNRNDIKFSIRNERMHNNDRDRHNRRGNSPGLSSSSSRSGGGSYDRKNDDRTRHNRNNGRRR